MRSISIMKEETSGTITSESSFENENPALLRAYDPPCVQAQSLRLITLGGSTGAGDSGAEESQFPGGNF